ncbi:MULTISPECIES: hypothetical protein [unclassified Sphingomonas]|uniref:hypothetical protein n=1 Tax=unclassified Sphingomonas TaxID=196159 RepID=UPI0008352CD6|nr:MULTISPECIES: hypothetical protein [unclassified Sphingomonas]
MLPLAAEPPVVLAVQADPVPLVRRMLPDQVVRGTFAPRLDAPYRQRLEQTRVVAGETARYTAERTVRFARDGEGGFRAEVTLVAIDGGIGRRVGAMFEAGLRGLLQRTMVFHLDAAGDIRSLDGVSGHWSAYLDGLGGQQPSGAGGDARRARLAELTAPMRSLPPERQARLLGSALSELIDPRAAARAGAPPQPLTREVRSPLGGRVTLTGSARAIADAGGLVVEEENAAGVLTATRTDAAGEMQVRETRRIDPATGLIVSRVRRERIVIPAGESVITTRTTLAAE